MMRSSRATRRRHSPAIREARRRRSRVAGISLIETMVASVLAAFLGILLATEPAHRSAAPRSKSSARARITQEGILAAQSLACDLGGFLADAPAAPAPRPSTRSRAGTSLKATCSSCISRGRTGTDVIAITYQLSGDQLVRSNSSTGVTTTIARYVTAFSVGQTRKTPARR